MRTTLNSPFFLKKKNKDINTVKLKPENNKSLKSDLKKLFVVCTIEYNIIFGGMYLLKSFIVYGTEQTYIK